MPDNKIPVTGVMILAPGFEETEAVTVIDLLRRAGISLTTAGTHEQLVKGSHDIALMCDTLLSNISQDQYDFIVLPGGQPGTNNLKSDQRVLDMVRKFNDKGKMVAAICAAPTVLATAGILKDVQVTSYPSERETFDTGYYLEQNVVQDSNVVTSRGVGTAISFSLSLVEQLVGKEERDLLAERILWPS